MSSSSARLSSTLTKSLRSPRDLNTSLPLFAALILLSVYVTIVALASHSAKEPGSLTFRISSDGDTPHVSWVMPAGLGWDQGVRPGMKVLSVNGEPVAGLSNISSEPSREAVLLTSAGEELHVEVPERAITRGAIKFSLWVVSGVFVLLGAAVVLRRPDSRAAWLFAIFAGAASIALAVAPSAGGPTPTWALIVQTLSVLSIGAIFPNFIAGLLEQPTRLRQLVTTTFTGFGFIIALGYGISVLIHPSLYELIKPAAFLYFSLAFLVSIVLLAVKGSRQKSTLSKEQARICLWGTTLSAFPFVTLSLIPEALGYNAMFPPYITVLAFALMPIFFAYAILQHQLLGIRRLVHRGMVYYTTTIALLLIVIVISLVAENFLSETDTKEHLHYLVPIFVVTGITLFYPLQRGARWMVDKFLYTDIANYQTFLEVVPRGELKSEHAKDIAAAITQRLVQVLNLESVLLFLNQDTADKPTAWAGERALEIFEHLHEKIEIFKKNPNEQDLIQLRWGSDSLLLACLKPSGTQLGHMLLGPKKGGEVFIEEEKRLVATMMPIIALSIEKAALSEEMRELNQRLVEAEERERARIAGDLHDGPLQKAIFLARESERSLREQGDIASQLIFEIREICSRLRPAVLDDLGIVPALEWLLDGVSRRSEVVTHFSLRSVGEEDRFSPEIEQTLFRVTQEAINNASKHAKAASLKVTLSKEDNNLILQVVDDGIGFLPSSNFKNGFGISGMRQRTLSVGGAFSVRSSPSQGTVVTVHIPIR